jgi:myo-inositol-1(or 4)-monophosphatase
LSQYNQILEVAKKASHSSAKIILNALDKPRNVDYKGKSNLVTQTDRKSEQNIKSIISEAFPEHGILGEETGKNKSDSPWLWVIDPLDGTTNFVHGYPSFSVSIGVLHQNKPVVGVVVELPLNRIYYAVQNEGSFCDDNSISVSTNSNLSQSLLVTGFGYEHGDLWKNNMRLFRHFTHITQGVRRLGAASVDLCHVASGKVDGFWEFDLHPWDTAAGILIVKEAGGMVSKMDRNPFSIYDKQILASNGNIHAKMLDEVDKELPDIIVSK